LGYGRSNLSGVEVSLFRIGSKRHFSFQVTELYLKDEIVLPWAIPNTIRNIADALLIKNWPYSILIS
jgi:hypothetical protein